VEPTLTYPTFGVETLAPSADSKEVLPEQFRLLYVPRSLIGRSYVADREFQVITVAGGMLLCFGSTGLSGRICVDMLNGRVVQQQLHDDSPPRFVNSTLAAFRDCVERVIACFPFYDSGSDLESRSAASERIADEIRRTDTAALDDPDGFWAMFLTDVEVGDYATQEIVDR
jgi:hypothetical protein